MAAIFLFLAASPVQLAYHTTELRRGSYPADADSISIPVFEFTLALLMASPILAGLVWVGIRRYRASSQFFDWAPAAPLRSLLWSGVFGAAAAVFAWDAAHLARDRHLVPALFDGLCAYFSLVLRAGAVGGLKVEQ
jgi:hypothetical protein